MNAQIDQTTIVEAYREAINMTHAWFAGVCGDRPPTDAAQRQYDARLDALQDMMMVIEQKTGLPLLPIVDVQGDKDELRGITHNDFLTDYAPHCKEDRP